MSEAIQQISIRSKLDKYLQEYHHLKSRIKEEIQALKVAKLKILYTKEAQEIVQSIAQIVQQKAHIKIVQIVNRCLESVFEDPCEFRIIFDKKRGKTEAKLVFFRDSHEVDPLTASGLGVVDVASFALRLSCLLLSSPRKRKLLVLDEPFRFVDAEKAERVRMMLMTLSMELLVQIILSTHNKQLMTGKIIDLGVST